MSKKIVVSLMSVLALFFFAFFSTSNAQEERPPKEPSHDREREPARQNPLLTDLPGDEIRGTPFYPDVLDNRARLSPDYTLGEPGLSYRYVETYGETGVAYSDDVTHLNGVYGIGTKSNNLFVAECDGHRLLKYAYNNNTSALLTIGIAGYRNTGLDTMDCIADVAVDSNNHIWIVDQGAQYVIEYDADGVWLEDLGVLWEQGNDNDHFKDPYGLAFDSEDNLYVSDTYNHRVQVFDNDGNYITTIGSGPGSGNNEFEEPLHITIDTNGKLYVADSINQRIQIFDVSNVETSVTRLGSIDLSGLNGFPQGVAVAIAQSRIYVADSNNNQVRYYNYTTWALSGSFGLSSWPADVAVDSGNRLYVALPTPGDSIVNEYNSALTFQRSFGTGGVPYTTDDLHYHEPSGIAVAPDNSLYIGESGGQRLIKLDESGNPVWTIGTPGIRGGSDTQFKYIEDVDTDSAGRVYVADRNNHRIQIYNSDGSHFDVLGNGQGSDPDQFNRPYGVAVGPDNRIYVADRNNSRVQIFDSGLNYAATITNTGASGGNWDFISPWDVDVDGAGNLYVADYDAHAVHVFDSSLVFVRTIGEAGVEGWDFGHFKYPSAVTVDASGHIFVSDSLNFIKVYDNSGAFLTILGGWFGLRTGDKNNIEGLAVDAAGNLYVADSENHRVQKFTPGVPGWKQVNINGFGTDNEIPCITALEPFDDHLYAGTVDWGEDGEQIWRMDSSGNWEEIVLNGLGNPDDNMINDFVEYRGQLYAALYRDDWNPSTMGGGVWRTSNGLDWTRVVNKGFGVPTNGEVVHLEVFSNTLYAGTGSWTSSIGAQIWSSDSGDTGDWDLVVSNGFNGDTKTEAVTIMEKLGSHLYAGSINLTTGGEIWRTSNGTSWSQVNSDGFGSTANGAILSFASFKNYLYAGTYHWSTGGQIWRCDSCDTPGDWSVVIGNGFGNGNNGRIEGLFVFEKQLFAMVLNNVTGTEIWKTTDGSKWVQVGFAGFGDSNNLSVYFDHVAANFNGNLFIGTESEYGYQGGEVWMYLHQVYLPSLMK